MSNKKQSQANRVLDHLLFYRALDSIDAWNHLGVYRVSQCISIIREQGYIVKTERTTRVNSWGEPITVALYKLV